MLHQAPHLNFQSEGAKKTKEAQPWFAPTGESFNFFLNWLKQPISVLFGPEMRQNSQMNHGK